MALQVIEGTWEEVKQHDAVLQGRHVRLTIVPERSEPIESASRPKEPLPKKLVGYGAFKGVFGGTEAFMAEKQEELDREERKFGKPRP